MAYENQDSLEDQIIEKFLENLENSEKISAEVSDAVVDLSEDSDFGGREQLKENILEVKGLDAD